MCGAALQVTLNCSVVPPARHWHPGSSVKIERFWGIIAPKPNVPATNQNSCTKGPKKARPWDVDCIVQNCTLRLQNPLRINLENFVRTPIHVSCFKIEIIVEISAGRFCSLFGAVWRNPQGDSPVFVWSHGGPPQPITIVHSYARQTNSTKKHIVLN